MKSSNRTFQTIRENYILVIDKTSAPKKRRESANIIANEIINFSFEKNNRKKDKELIDKERKRKIDKKEINNPSYDDRPYKNHVYAKLKFLCDHEYILRKFQPSLEHLLRSGYKEKNTDVLDAKNEDIFYSLHEILNQVIKWFLEIEVQPYNYLVPIHFIAKNQDEYQIAAENEIVSFLNIKKEETNRFKKYQTVLALIITLIIPFFILVYSLSESLGSEFGTFLLPELPGIINPIYSLTALTITVIISSIGIFNTFKYVKKRSLKKLRYLIFSLNIFVWTLLFIVGVVYIIDSFQDEPKYYSNIYLDADPNNSGEGFLSLVSIYEPNTKLNYLDSKNTPTDSSGFRKIKLTIDLKNIGQRKLDNTLVDFYTKESDSIVIIQVNVSNVISRSIYDIVILKKLAPQEMLFCAKSKIIYTLSRENRDNKVVYYDSIVNKSFCKNFRRRQAINIEEIQPSDVQGKVNISIVFEMTLKNYSTFN